MMFPASSIVGTSSIGDIKAGSKRGARIGFVGSSAAAPGAAWKGKPPSSDSLVGDCVSIANAAGLSPNAESSFDSAGFQISIALRSGPELASSGEPFV